MALVAQTSGVQVPDWLVPTHERCLAYAIDGSRESDMILCSAIWKLSWLCHGVVVGCRIMLSSKLHNGRQVRWIAAQREARK